VSISYKTPSYFSDFSCLGGDCEDTCCRNWEVKLDRKHYDALSSVMLKDNEEKARFEQYIHLNDKSITSDHDYAFIRMSVNGYCAMLDESGLCSIHVKHGVTVMGNVCTMFPRVISRCADTIELSGALSCPEVVRNCIADKTPLKLNRFKPADLPRNKNYPIQRELSISDDDYYSENFSLVRQSMMNIMGSEKYDFETRLYTISYLTNNISTFYHQGCRSANSGQLETILNDVMDDDFISKLDSVIKDFEPNSSISMIVVHSILSIKLTQSKNENISQLYQKIIDEFKADDTTIASMLTCRLSKVKEGLTADNQKYIEQALTRYMINCLYREWFISMPDPFIYFQMLLVRITMLRSLIYLDSLSEADMTHYDLKDRIVYIMYNFARNIDQNHEFLKVVYNALSEQTMMNFDFSPTFIRLY
jgi:lysine-N-methylase